MISINDNEIIVERSTNNFEDSDEIWVETFNYYSKYDIDKSKTKYNTNTKYNVYGNHYYAKIPNLFNQNELPVVKILTQANQDSIEIERLLAIETRQDKFEIISNRCSPLIIFNRAYLANLQSSIKDNVNITVYYENEIVRITPVKQDGIISEDLNNFNSISLPDNINQSRIRVTIFESNNNESANIIYDYLDLSDELVRIER